MDGSAPVPLSVLVLGTTPHVTHVSLTSPSGEPDCLKSGIVAQERQHPFRLQSVTRAKGGQPANLTKPAILSL